jgi:hypothetical protein
MALASFTHQRMVVKDKQPTENPPKGVNRAGPGPGQ